MGDIGNHGVCSAMGGRGYLWPRRLELLGAGLVLGTFRFLVGPYPLALVLFGQVNELQEKKLQESCAGRLPCARRLRTVASLGDVCICDR